MDRTLAVLGFAASPPILRTFAPPSWVVAGFGAFDAGAASVGRFAIVGGALACG
jgi:hypothetical protein